MPRMLKTRIITALIWVPVSLAAILWLETVYLAYLFGLLMILGSWEWSGLCNIHNRWSRCVYTGLSLFLMGYCYQAVTQYELVRFIFPIVSMIWGLIFFGLVLMPANKMRNQVFNSCFGALIGWILLIPTWLGWLWLHAIGEQGIVLLLVLFLLVWGSDTGAYFVGKWIGKTKLAPFVSPSKTLEGFYGGALLTLVMAYGLAQWLDLSGNSTVQFVSIGALVAIFSVIGDLFESAAKRASQVKDSGSAFPGHGGVMDRIDSLTAATPVYLLGFSWFPHLLA